MNTKEATGKWMPNRFFALLLAVVTTIALCGLPGCGGGGSGGSGGTSGGTVVGRVLNVETGGPISPAATVQVGSNTAQTSPADGSFIVAAPTGATSLLVDTPVFGVWTFTIPTVNGTVDAGDLWVGSQMVTLTGRVVSSVDNQPIELAKVTFGGRTGITNSQGIFTLTNVAYSAATQTAFWGIEGSAIATGYFNSTFSAAPAVANNGIVTVADVPLTPTSDTTPPDPPANILGRVTPSGQALGTIVTLKDHLGNAVRIFNVGSNGEYAFWAPPDNYTITYVNGPLSASDQAVNLTAPDQVVHVPDVVLHG